MAAMTEGKNSPPFREKVHSIKFYNLQVQSKSSNRGGQDLVAAA